MGNMFKSNTQEYRSIKDLRLRKAEILAEITKNSNKMQVMWDSLIHPVPASNVTPTQKFSGFISKGANFMDALILGWKLYNKFSGKKKIGFFGKKR